MPPFAAEVDLAAIRRNVNRLVDVAGDAAVMAVVKADGYGHGMVASARAAVAGGATWLGVAFVEEAVTLRDAGIDVPLLAWLVAPGTDLTPAASRAVDVAVGAPWGLTAAAGAARATGRAVRIHLEADTGLGRGGATDADWPALCEQAAKLAAEGLVEVVGIWSHLACADEPGHPSLPAQQRAFELALERAAAAGLTPQVRHLANSAATLALPGTHYDLVRAGVAVYGLSPGPDIGTSAALGLRPAMRVTAEVGLAKRVAAGQGVSYGHRYTTVRDATLALVPMGYADGIPRHATNVGPVLIGGRRFTVSGTVCMDQFVVDVGDLAVSAGDPVVVFGPGDDGEPTADEWAAAVGSINYEIVTRVGARVPRTYVGEQS